EQQRLNSLSETAAANDNDDNDNDLQRPWADPMAAPGTRHFAQDTRQQPQYQQQQYQMAGLSEEMPAWKKKSFGATTTFGKVTSLSIMEQRASLPIYQLRTELIRAVVENQVLVVIGDTGSGKTTQMTQYLAEEGLTLKGKIGC